jgi:hypothetical protein
MHTMTASFDIDTLIARARDPSLDDETRYAAVMTITASVYNRRTRQSDMAESRTAQPPPRQHVVTHQGRSDVPTVKAFLTEQLMIVDHRDSDGRPIGLDYNEIAARLLKAFPTVLRPGSGQGQPPSTDRKTLHELAYQLRREGHSLPHRPRTFDKPRRGHPLSAEHRAKIGAARRARAHRERDAHFRPGFRSAAAISGTMVAAEVADALFTHLCAQCGQGYRPAGLDNGRGIRREPLYCGHACGQAAFRQREAERIG